ncbi:NERD domain-containing protein [Alkaliphilus peptidifermentans]|uniref:Nuclease-related domain-containing protein n=1 Tax=Alkaliphilus peptidifermentans DSM 18978 TaxID=1120976 RepID=A0A1G5ADJ6_9FIRM|nr:nuclease-related domain-containing protein [Alkaliphilus peptidifermentans]SCX75936.1 Nuclease-related domain-containing protein [Alkaliphilus peptidifermentans DSM 18978]
MLNTKNRGSKKTIERFIKDPLWLYFLGISFFGFILAESSSGYMLASILLLFTIVAIYYLYIDKAEALHKQAMDQFSSFNQEYTLLSAVTLQNEASKGYSDFIVISPKGIFNIRALDFEGTIKGYESEDTWSYTKLTGPYDITQKLIRNPVHFHQKTHDIIHDLLMRNNIRYIPIQSIIVIRNEDAEIHTNSNIPIVKVKNLHQYITQHSDRHNMFSLIDEIVGIFKSEGHYSLKTMEKAMSN